jgi:hypothetical protein
MAVTCPRGVCSAVMSCCTAGGQIARCRGAPRTPGRRRQVSTPRSPLRRPWQPCTPRTVSCHGPALEARALSGAAAQALREQLAGEAATLAAREQDVAMLRAKMEALATGIARAQTEQQGASVAAFQASTSTLTATAVHTSCATASAACCPHCPPSRLVGRGAGTIHATSSTPLPARQRAPPRRVSRHSPVDAGGLPRPPVAAPLDTQADPPRRLARVALGRGAGG